MKLQHQRSEPLLSAQRSHTYRTGTHSGEWLQGLQSLSRTFIQELSHGFSPPIHRNSLNYSHCETLAAKERPHTLHPGQDADASPLPTKQPLYPSGENHRPDSCGHCFLVSLLGLLSNYAALTTQFSSVCVLMSYKWNHRVSVLLCLCLFLPPSSVFRVVLGFFPVVLGSSVYSCAPVCGFCGSYFAVGHFTA